MFIIWRLPHTTCFISVTFIVSVKFHFWWGEGAGLHRGVFHMQQVQEALLYDFYKKYVWFWICYVELLSNVWWKAKLISDDHKIGIMCITYALLMAVWIRIWIFCMGQPERNLKVNVLLCIPGRLAGNWSYWFLTWALDGGERSALLRSLTILLLGKEALEPVLTLWSRKKSVASARNQTMISWLSNP